MTDETGAGVPPESETASSEWSAQIAKLGPGEKFAVLGAAGVLAVWLLFDLLIDEYGIGTVSLVLALVVSVGAYRHHNGGSDGWAVPYRTIVWTGAALIGFLGAYWFIEEVRGSIFDRDAATIIGALAYYVSAAVAGLGAWQLRGK